MTNTEENTADSLVVDTDFGGEEISKEEADIAETEDLARALLADHGPSAEQRERGKFIFDKVKTALQEAEPLANTFDQKLALAAAWQQLVYPFGTGNF